MNVNENGETPIEQSIEKLDARVMALRELVASAGWKEYIAIVEEQAAYREQQVILVPLSSADQVYAQEFAKGELNALRSTKFMPEHIIEGDLEQLKVLRAAREAEANPDGETE